MTLQKEKCVFFQTSIDFFGNVFSSEGISPHSSKVNALQQASRPTDKSQVQSLLGLVNYVQRYISNVATLVKPLRNLTKKNANFFWNEECENAFQSIKKSITCESTLSYFNPKHETELVVDASPVGLAAILTQRTGKKINIIAYSSRTLNDVETRYSQVEREALAINTLGN